jgi:putative SOS response-associated peptidase YedK
MGEDRGGQAALRDRARRPAAHGAGGSVGDLALAGGRKRVRSFTIVTTTPNELCAELHNRMPVVLKPDVWPVWLGASAGGCAAARRCWPPTLPNEMICWPVSPRVGNVKNYDPSLIEAIVLQ